MSKYINAEQLEKDYWMLGRYEPIKGGAKGAKFVWKKPTEMPTADVVEIKRGWWLEEERPTCYVYRCTACGDEFDAPYNYCPNCGARMVDVDEVEE